VRALELTSVQQASLDALQEETTEAIRPVIEQVHALREQIDEAASAPSADPCEVGAMAIEAGGLHSKIESIRKASEAKFVAGLSEEQKARYDEYVAVHPNCLAVGGGFFFRSLP
jgi:LTXXQ motif family protein